MSDTRNFQEADQKTIRNIICNYIQNEKALVNQLYFKVSHGTTIGGFREDIWRGMFEQIVPKKFAIEQSVFIMDSEGRVSNEVDLAIFDETYTPYIFRYGRLKFLPIEAVAVVIECKSTSLAQSKLKNWAESIAVLKTSSQSYTRTINKIVVGEEEPSPTQTATRPVRILCCLNEEIVNASLDSGDKLFDIIVRAPSEDQGMAIEMDETKEDLQSWYLALNHADKKEDIKNGANIKGINNGVNIKGIKIDAYQVNGRDTTRDATGAESKRVSLLTFNLQLNQLLMLINNPMLFPHMKYAKMFDRFGRNEDGQ